MESENGGSNILRFEKEYVCIGVSFKDIYEKAIVIQDYRPSMQSWFSNTYDFFVYLILIHNLLHYLVLHWTRL